MKTKKIRKTLSLNKFTVVNLNGSEASSIKGGVYTPGPSPPVTYESWCDCISLELACPSSTCPMDSCDTCVSCEC
jgi:hypothetical protein